MRRNILTIMRSEPWALFRRAIAIVCVAFVFVTASAHVYGDSVQPVSVVSSIDSMTGLVDDSGPVMAPDVSHCHSCFSGAVAALPAAPFVPQVPVRVSDRTSIAVLPATFSADTPPPRLLA